MKSDPNAVWLVSPDVRSTYSEDGAVLLDIRKGLCYSLNPVAARVWSTVEAGPSGVDLRGLVDVMETHFTISREQLEHDVDEYVSKLENIGLVQRNGYFTNPRPPERGVDMFRNTWCASVTTELSNATAAWTCDSMGPASNTAAFGYAANVDRVPIFASKPAHSPST